MNGCAHRVGWLYMTLKLLYLPAWIAQTRRPDAPNISDYKNHASNRRHCRHAGAANSMQHLVLWKANHPQVMLFNTGHVQKSATTWNQMCRLVLQTANFWYRWIETRFPDQIGKQWNLNMWVNQTFEKTWVCQLQYLRGSVSSGGGGGGVGWWCLVASGALSSSPFLFCVLVWAAFVWLSFVYALFAPRSYRWLVVSPVTRSV